MSGRWAGTPDAPERRVCLRAQQRRRDDGLMSDVDLPKIGAPATRGLAAIGISRLEDVADRTEAELWPSTASVPEPCAF